MTPGERDYNGLRRWRIARGLTQEQAAYLLGISPRHIGRIETGARLLTPTLERLMTLL